MKQVLRFSILIILLIFTINVNGQNLNHPKFSIENGTITAASPMLTVTFSTTPVTCYASMDGSIDLTATGGTPPYSYAWSTGANTEDISNLPQGSYSVTVVDAAGGQFIGNAVIATSGLPTTLQWEKSYGGEAQDIALEIQQTQDGGYIVAGYTESWGGDVQCHGSLYNQYWIIKLDANGNLVWKQCFLEGLDDKARSIKQTSDGGYIVTGIKQVNFDYPVGDSDPWTIKLDANGNMVWQHYHQGDYGDRANDVIQMKDGSYVVAGSYALPQLGNYYYYYDDFLIYKLNSSGNQVWGRRIGGSDNEWSSAVAELNNGALIATGTTYSNDGSVSGNHGGSDVWLVRMTGTGGVAWKKCLGGSLDDSASDILATPDAGSILVGRTESSNGDVSYNHGGRDCWVVKLNSLGIIEWEKTYGGSNDDWGRSIHPTSDGGYIISASTLSNDGDVTGNHGLYDFWVFKIDATGTLLWQKTFGGSSYDLASSIDLTSDGGFVAAGGSFSSDGDVSTNQGDYDFWILKSGYPDVINTQVDAIQPVSCTVNDGGIDITASGGSPPYSYLWSEGSTDEDVTGLSIGDYYVTISDSNGCASVEGPIAVGPLTTIGLQIDQNVPVSCNGVSDGSISITSNNGTAPYSFLWSNGSTTEDISDLESGTYGVTVTDVNGCVSNNDTIFVSFVSSPTASRSQKPVSCGSTSNGWIKVNIYGGTPPYTYLWSHGSTVEDPVNLESGNYFVTITDMNGCYSEYGPIFIDIHPELTVLLDSVQHVSCNNTSDGSIQIKTDSVNAAGQAYYLWSNGVMGYNRDHIYGLSAGDYYVTVYGSYSCKRVLGPISVLSTPDLTLSTTNQVTCYPSSSGSIDLTLAGGTPPYFINWSNGAITEDLYNLSDGNYSVTVLDAIGCQVTANAVFSTSTLPTSIHWEKSFGGKEQDYANSIQQTQDGGYIVAGTSYSADGDVLCSNNTSGEYWVIKLDPTGNLQWQQCFSGGLEDNASKIQQTTDGGYIISGSKRISFAFPSNTDPWTIKLDANGNMVWDHTEQGDYFDHAHDVIQMKNGSYVVAGFKSIAQPGKYRDDFLIYKLNSSGNQVWRRIVGGDEGEQATAVAELNNGALIVTGFTYSNNGSVTGNHGDADVWLVRMTGTGGIAWKKCLGGTNYDAAHDILATPDAGYILVGETESWNGDVSSNKGAKDCWVVKLNSQGNIEWQRTYGGSGSESASSIQPTADGGYIVSAYTNSTDGDVTGNQGSTDYWVFKIDAVGNLIWQKTFGGSMDENALAIDVTSEQGYVLAGYSYSSNGDVSTNNGDKDFWIVKAGYLDEISMQIDTIQLLSCNNASDGSISITSFGGLPPYTYLWSNGSTTEDVSGLVDGNYYVTITDSNGCSGNDGPISLNSFGITIDQITPVSCSGDSDGSIGLTPLGSNPPYTYLWSNGSTSEDIFNLVTGNYFVTITDAIGCYSDYGPININALADIGVAINSISPVSCNSLSDGGIDITAGGGTAPYSYLWSNGSTQQDLNNVPVGSYLVTITDTDGCHSVHGPIMIDKIQNTITINVTHIRPVSCNNTSNGRIFLNVGGNAPFTYLWSNGSGYKNLYYLSAGDYYVSVTDAVGCLSVLGPITVPSSTPELTFSISPISCIAVSDGSIDLSVAGGTAPYSYNWSNGSMTEDIANLGTGNYSVTVVDSLGCQTVGTTGIPIFPTNLQWEKTLGGTGNDYLNSIQQTQDEGYIVAGKSNSTNGDISCQNTQTSYWISKLDASGVPQWDKCFASGLQDEARSIQQSSDGGYIVSGIGQSNPADSDPWTIKLDANGAMVWDHIHQGDYWDGANEVIQMKNGEYVIAGYWSPASNSNDSKFLIYKLNSSGNQLWSRIVGGSDQDVAMAVDELNNNGALVVTGYTFSNDGSVTGNHGEADVWLVRMTGAGGIAWKKCFGGSKFDAAYDILATPDAGYILVGETESADGDVSFNHGSSDCWVVKLNSLGVIEWEKTYGGSGTDGAISVQANPEGGYIIAAHTTSNDGDVTGNHGLNDYWTFKIDEVGNLIWQSTFGGSSSDVATAMDVTTDGGFVVAGYSGSSDGDISINKGQQDFWIAKSGYSCQSACLDLNIKLWLEAPLNNTSTIMSNDLYSRGLLPTIQPFDQAPWHYNGLEGDGWTISDYPADAVDWVLISLRTDSTPSSTAIRKAGILLSDGSVQFPGDCIFSSVLTDSSYFVLVEHRNHMGAMTPGPVSVQYNELVYDFRLQNSYNSSGAAFGQTQPNPGVWALIAGDIDQSDFPSYDVNSGDKLLWSVKNGLFNQYDGADVNMDGDINGLDRLIWQYNSGLFSGVLR